jgi:hypothetical protein
MHYKHDVKCENMYVSINPEERKKKLHSVLSYKIDCLKSECKSTESGCINRDKNSVLNMERIVKELLNSGKRLQLFRRDNSISPRS